jgi:hypothetical protein
LDGNSIAQPADELRRKLDKRHITQWLKQIDPFVTLLAGWREVDVRQHFFCARVEKRFVPI